MSEKARNADPWLRFIPSRVEGLTGVSEVVVRSDRLALRSDGGWVVLPFDRMARWPRLAPVWRLLARAGWRPRWLPVADRDWFHRPRDRFFRFYSDPPIVLFLADEQEDIGYGESLFRRVQDVIGLGGFDTCDLG